jgi:hypothetical protein
LGSSLPARRGAWILAFLAAVVALTGFALPRPQTPAPARSTAAANPASQSVSQASVNPQPKPLDTEAAQKNPDAAGSAHNRQIAADSAKLLKLATDLKAEVDKTNKDTLSLKVIRKADEIEHFAHNVREKVKPAVGANEGGRR